MLHQSLLQRALPLQLKHRYLIFPCSQMPPPLHLIQRYFRTPCSQIPRASGPEHELHLLLSISCSHMLPPSQSLQMVLILSCSHMLPPAHVLQIDLRFLCSQKTPAIAKSTVGSYLIMFTNPPTMTYSTHILLSIVFAYLSSSANIASGDTLTM